MRRRNQGNRRNCRSCNRTFYGERWSKKVGDQKSAKFYSDWGKQHSKDTGHDPAGGMCLLIVLGFFFVPWLLDLMLVRS